MPFGKQPRAVTCREQQELHPHGMSRPPDQSREVVDKGRGASLAEGVDEVDNRVVPNVPQQQTGGTTHANAPS